jgi:hypothetical protein
VPRLATHVLDENYRHDQRFVALQAW